MTLPTLRPYQEQAKAEIYGAWGSGARNAVLVLPTGGGKSVIVSSMTRDAALTNERSIVIAHRQELVGQMSLHVARAGVPHQIIGPRNVTSLIVSEHRREFGRSFIEPNATHYVAGIDTLKARQADLKDWARQIRRWTVDEAHHVLAANKWGIVADLFPSAYGLGVTATPQRADGNGIGDEDRGGAGLFAAMILGPSMRWLIDNGSLTDYEIVIPASDFDVESLKVGNSGDYSSVAMREAAKASHIVGDVVTEYLRWAPGKRGITFATDVETAGEIAQRFNDMDVPAAAVSAKTDDRVRAEYVRRFRDGQLLQLVNVDLFGEGFDLPAIEVVSMARPTASLAVFMQQFGRALRPLAGKRIGLVIDHVSNVKRHGMPDRARQWTLASRDRRVKKKSDPDDIPVNVCVKCSKAYEGVKRKCPYCGYMPVAEGGGRSVEEVAGDLMLLDTATLAALREGVELPSPAAVASRAAYVTGNEHAAQAALNRQTDKIAEQFRLKEAIAVWAGKQRALGRPDDESYRRFYFATKGIDVLSALKMDRADMEKLRMEIEQW